MGECRRLEIDEDGDGNADVIEVQEGAPPFQNTTTNVTDYDLDGMYDEIWSRTFDAEGRVLTSEVDVDADGVFENRDEFTYDDNGNITSHVLTDGEGIVIFRMTATWDDQSRLLTWVHDDGDDGTPDYTDTRTYVGEWLENLTIVDQADGIADMVITWTFDANGHPMRGERDGIYDIEAGNPIRAPDGNPDVIQDVVFDVDGNLIQLQQDGDVGPNREESDGTFDRFQRGHQYNAAGQLVYVEKDGRNAEFGTHVAILADGTFDAQSFAYDANGNQTQIQYDVGDDGSNELELVNTFDANNLITMRTLDGIVTNDSVIMEVADGTPNYVETITWLDVDKPLSRSIDFDNDGVMEVVQEWTWSATGVFTGFRSDGDWFGWEFRTTADGTWDVEDVIELNADELPTSMTNAQDGVVNRAISYSYGDCADLL